MAIEIIFLIVLVIHSFICLKVNSACTYFLLVFFSVWRDACMPLSVRKACPTPIQSDERACSSSNVTYIHSIKLYSNYQVT